MGAADGAVANSRWSGDSICEERVPHGAAMDAAGVPKWEKIRVGTEKQVEAPDSPSAQKNSPIGLSKSIWAEGRQRAAGDACRSSG